MRWLVWYIDSMFCRHDWLIEEFPYEVKDEFGDLLETGIRVSATCKKCGWHRKYKKF